MIFLFGTGLPNLYELAKEISPDNNKFRHLDAAQLIKHILGLKKKYSNTPRIVETTRDTKTQNFSTAQKLLPLVFMVRCIG